MQYFEMELYVYELKFISYKNPERIYNVKPESHHDQWSTTRKFYERTVHCLSTGSIASLHGMDQVER